MTLIWGIVVFFVVMGACKHISEGGEFWTALGAMLLFLSIAWAIINGQWIIVVILLVIACILLG